MLAVDLPFLNEQTLADLIAARDPHAPATAYQSAHDGLPEPLCAIWEPAAGAPLLAAIERGERCPRKFLIRSHARLVALRAPDALENINTPEEYATASAAIGSKVAR